MTDITISLPPLLTGDISGDRCVYMWGPFDGAFGRFTSYEGPKYITARMGDGDHIYRAHIVDGYPVRDDRDNVILYFEGAS